MRFRLHGDSLHVHGCPDHASTCDFFDHAPVWLLGNREAARTQLTTYRSSVVTRISALSAILVSIDWMLARLSSVQRVA